MLKKICYLFFIFFVLMFVESCASASGEKGKYIEKAPRDRILELSGKLYSEADFGGVERWFAVDKYNSDGKVRFQVGYFKDEPNIGFVLYEGGVQGELAIVYRDGLNLRWDWSNYAIVVESNGTAFYYDFKYQKTNVKPRDLFRVYKF